MQFSTKKISTPILLVNVTFVTESLGVNEHLMATKLWEIKALIFSSSFRLYGLFRQSLNGTGTRTGTGTSIMLIPSHCNVSGTGTGNLRICLRVLNRDPNVPHGFVYIMPGNDVTLV